MQITQRSTRGIALLAGGIFAFSTLHPTPAHADKSSNYKAGAVGLGALAAGLLLKGKTLPGVLAGAGAYYAYKKSQDAKRDQQYARYPDDNTSYNYPDNRDNTGYYGDGRDDGTYRNDGGYSNNGAYNRPTDGYYRNDGGDGYNRTDAGSYRTNEGDGNYASADNYPTYNNQYNYPATQDSGQYYDRQDRQASGNDGYVVTNNNPAYSQTTPDQSNGSYPNYGYRAFSQGRAARHHN